MCMGNVQEDRANNEVEAFQKRQAAAGTEDTRNAIDEDSSTDDDVIDPGFW